MYDVTLKAKVVFKIYQAKISVSRQIVQKALNDSRYQLRINSKVLAKSTN